MTVPNILLFHQYALDLSKCDITYSLCARRAGSDGTMSASGSEGSGFDPSGVINFYLKTFNLGARRGGDVHFLIARLNIADLD